MLKRYKRGDRKHNLFNAALFWKVTPAFLVAELKCQIGKKETLTFYISGLTLARGHLISIFGKGQLGADVPLLCAIVYRAMPLCVRWNLGYIWWNWISQTPGIPNSFDSIHSLKKETPRLFNLNFWKNGEELFLASVAHFGYSNEPHDPPVLPWVLK